MAVRRSVPWLWGLLLAALSAGASVQAADPDGAVDPETLFEVLFGAAYSLASAAVDGTLFLAAAALLQWVAVTRHPRPRAAALIVGAEVLLVGAATAMALVF